MSTTNQTPFLSLPMVLLALACASVSTQIAHATDWKRDPPSVKVLFSDLDLSSQHGTATLYTRIVNAARTVCGPVDISLVEERVNWEQCVDRSIAYAVAKVGNSNLTAYFLAKTRRSYAIGTAQISVPGPVVVQHQP
jgi:UrcA family protein